MGLVFCEQVAVDSGKYELAWLLTGLQKPPFHLIEKNTKTYDQPYGQLVDARWMGINLHFLKDIDYLEQRARLHQQQRTPVQDQQQNQWTQKSWKRWKSKEKKKEGVQDG